MKKHFNTALLAASFLLANISHAAGAHGGGHGDHHAAVSAIGKPGTATSSTRVVKVEMTDAMRFSPATIRVKQNETVRFVVTNLGKLRHEMVLGTQKDLKEHYEEMKKNPEMEHDDPNMVTLEAGKTGEMVWQFSTAGKVDFACLQAGHYEAGMKGAVKVSPTAAASSKPPKAHAY